MSHLSMSASTTFDACVTNYDAQLDLGLSATGEDKDYFARGRIACIRGVLRDLGVRPSALMDFGCGTGSTTPLLLSSWNDSTLVGVDSSSESIRVAQNSHGSERAQFTLVSGYKPEGAVDLVYCNGVFHHIPPSERARSINFVRESMAPGGVFACCENNPWNPGTRYVMRRIPFDKDANPISPPQARRMLRAAGFDILRTEFLFFFPRQLARLRPLESMLATIPLGGQYIVFARAA